MGGVGDEVAPGPGYAFEAAQGADGDAAEDLHEELVCEAGRRVPLLGGRLHLVESGSPAVRTRSPRTAVGSPLISDVRSCAENKTASQLLCSRIDEAGDN